MVEFSVLINVLKKFLYAVVSFYSHSLLKPEVVNVQYCWSTKIGKWTVLCKVFHFIRTR